MKPFEEPEPVRPPSAPPNFEILVVAGTLCSDEEAQLKLRPHPDFKDKKSKKKRESIEKARKHCETYLDQRDPNTEKMYQDWLTRKAAWFADPENVIWVYKDIDASITSLEAHLMPKRNG